MASVEVTLSLLAGPTRAAVSSALYGASAATLLYASSNPALCFVARVPYDDAIFKHQQDGNTEPLPIRANLSTTFKPRRPVGRVAFKRLITPKNLTLTTVRNVGLSSLLAINTWIGRMQEAEEAAMIADVEPIYPPFPVNELKRAAKRGCINACLDWLTQLVRSVLDTWAAKNLTLVLSNRLRKELKPSVVRKTKYPYYERGLRVVKTSLFSEFTLYAADFTVACAVETYNMWKAAVKINKARLKLLFMRCALHSARCSLVLVAVSLGNGLGSTAPGKGKGLAMFVLAQVASFTVNSRMHSIIASYNISGAEGVPPPPPPPAEPAAAEVDWNDTDPLPPPRGPPPGERYPSLREAYFALEASQLANLGAQQLEAEPQPQAAGNPPDPPAAAAPQDRQVRGGLGRLPPQRVRQRRAAAGNQQQQMPMAGLLPPTPSTGSERRPAAFVVGDDQQQQGEERRQQEASPPMPETPT